MLQPSCWGGGDSVGTGDGNTRLAASRRLKPAYTLGSNCKRRFMVFRLSRTTRLLLFATAEMLCANHAELHSTSSHRQGWNKVQTSLKLFSVAASCLAWCPLHCNADDRECCCAVVVRPKPGRIRSNHPKVQQNLRTLYSCRHIAKQTIAIDKLLLNIAPRLWGLL